MKCSNCGESIDKDCRFCRYCGTKVITNSSSTHSDGDDSDQTTSEQDRLWGKFAEIYNSTGVEKKLFLDLSSNEVWELIKRVSTNKFEDFIQENRALLNKQPYKVIEKLKNIFSWCASGGYWFWMAEALLKNEELLKPKSFALNSFIEEWQILVRKDFSELQKDFTPYLEQSINIFFEVELNEFLSAAESVKELPNEFVENLKAALFVQIFWGYLCGVAEAKYRK